METYKFETFVDDRGVLFPFEFNSFPFEPRRVFLVYDVPIDCIRGNHAHYETKQILVCLDGTVEVILHDGKEENSYLINKNEGLYVPNLIWDSQKFLSTNSKLLVFCSTNYDEKDYIFDFNFFKKYVNNK